MNKTSPLPWVKGKKQGTGVQPEHLGPCWTPFGGRAPVDGVYCRPHTTEYGGHAVFESATDADTRRILACINAMSNVTTEFLEWAAQNSMQVTIALSLARTFPASGVR